MPATVLLVEDDFHSQRLMAYLLENAGYRVLSASDGQAGLELAQLEEPDLIVMDIQMPVMDGYELARSLRRDTRFRHTRLVAVTAVAMVGDREKVLGAGLDLYMTKPIVPEEFVARIEDLLEPHKRARRAAGGGGVPAPEVAPQSPAPEPAARTGPRVLVVDDRDENLRLARMVLEPSGFRVETASDVAGALAHARSDPPDLILSDLHVADRSGYELLNAVRADRALAAVPVVLITASQPAGPSSDRFAELGVSDFIVRPVEPGELLARVQAALGDGSGG